MGSLKVLPAQIANMIAAGEVVQRPSSVVKELMENAIDAGATKVNVILSDAGRTLIQIIDNGSGMSPADAVLCFERHATSKIATADDLANILTYGFRGEALASIAAVAEVTLKTRRPQDETGVQVTVSEGGQTKSAPAAVPVGSNFVVRNLFYNVPARRKFLKNDNVELKHCVQEFTHIAITRPEIEFSLTHNGRDLFVLKKAKSLKFRIMELLGNTLADELVDIEADTSVARIRGFAGRPQSAKKTLGNQYFFVDGRYFRSPYLHKAVMKAYEDMIPSGATPSYIIFLDVDPRSIDVNVSPTKTEIKFEDESVIFQILYACLRETLGRNSFGASIDFESEGAVRMPQIGRSFEEYRGEPMTPSVEFDSDYDPFNPEGTAAPVFDGQPGGRSVNYEAGPAEPGEDRPEQKGWNDWHDAGWKNRTDRDGSYGALFEQKAVPAAKVLTVKDKYLVTPVFSGLMAINVKRARERILYERYLRALTENSHVTQTALFPVQVQVGVENRLLFDANADLLASLGFDITPFGNDTVAVGGVPEGCSCETGKVEQLVRDLLVILSEDRSALPTMVQSSLAAKFASAGAASSVPPASPVEAQSLIDALFACDNSELTPSGKRIVGIISIEEIDKKLT